MPGLIPVRGIPSSPVPVRCLPRENEGPEDSQVEEAGMPELEEWDLREEEERLEREEALRVVQGLKDSDEDCRRRRTKCCRA